MGTGSEYTGIRGSKGSVWRDGVRRGAGQGCERWERVAAGDRERQVYKQTCSTVFMWEGVDTGVLGTHGEE